jgi:serine/threonine protein kinase
LGRYRIEKLAGEGSFAWVYRARTTNGETVAAKILHSHHPTAAVRFAREIRVLKALPANPHVAQLVDHGQTPDGRPVLVLEFVDGITLKVGIKRRPTLAAQQAVPFVAELCGAFVGLHQLGVAHRDVKPENIIMVRDGGIKLIDFGLIRDAQGILQLLEKQDPLELPVFQEELDQGVLAGTPEYMAPEQFSDSALDDVSQTNTDTWSDVFSLGVILFELLTGRKPFVMRKVGASEYPHELLRYLRWRIRLRDKDTPKIPGISPALQSIIHKALRRDPRARQPDARALMDDLLRYQATGQGVTVFDDTQTQVASVQSILAAHHAARAQPPPLPRDDAEVSSFFLFNGDRSQNSVVPPPLPGSATPDRGPKGEARRSASPEVAPADANTNLDETPTGITQAELNHLPSEDLEVPENRSGQYRPPSAHAHDAGQRLDHTTGLDDDSQINLAVPPSAGGPVLLRQPTDAQSLARDNYLNDWDDADLEPPDSLERCLSDDNAQIDLAKISLPADDEKRRP